MSQHLGSRHNAIPSPWTDYAIYALPDGSQLDQCLRQPVMDAMNGIIATNWKATEPHWTAASSPFDSKFSLILVYEGPALIAFSVYRQLQIAGCRAIYRSGTEVLPAHQGRGLYGFFTSEILKTSATADNGPGGLLYGWRTRNPIVWVANAKICDRVAPSLLGATHDPALEAACVEMCSSLYPGKSLELPAMIMRGAYGHIEHRRQDYRGTASLVDAAISQIIPDTADALFSVGLARV